MPIIYVKTKDPTLIPLLTAQKKPTYEVVAVPPETPLDTLSFDTANVHGLIADADLLNPRDIVRAKVLAGESTFPVMIATHGMTDVEAGRWISSGISDIFRLPVPPALISRRIASVVQLLCMSCSLHGQVTDALTGLYGRGAFYHFAREMISCSPESRYTVIQSDIVNFKRINERFGEKKGDELLRFVGSMLRQMNNENVLFARYGGDQFVGILRIPENGLEFSQEMLTKEMERFYAAAPIEHFSVKFGIYEDVDQSLPVSIMCDRAQMALKTVRDQYGRSCGRYTPQLQQKFNREQQILDSMEAAIQEHQIEIYYQPKHDAKTGAVIGAEALARWTHPVYGFLSPGEFIPLFESSGFITMMDAYVWNQVCLDLRDMIAKGLPVVPISVNFSRKDLASERFAQTLRKPLEDCGLDPALLHAELTESVFMEDTELLVPVMRQLREYGIRIELDDFGAGYSSLGILSRLPVDIIKLDMSLTRDIEAHPTIISGVIQMMHSLGYEITAEGAEDAAQVDLLRVMDCDHIQGYYYSKPLTKNGFYGYLSTAEVKKA